MIQTPEFKGTHLWDRLMWAKQNLEPYNTEYRIVWEDPSEPEECAKVTSPVQSGWAVRTRWYLTQ